MLERVDRIDRAVGHDPARLPGDTACIPRNAALFVTVVLTRMTFTVTNAGIHAVNLKMPTAEHAADLQRG